MQIRVGLLGVGLLPECVEESHTEEEGLRSEVVGVADL